MSPLVLDEIINSSNSVIDLFLRKSRIGPQEKCIVHDPIGRFQPSVRHSMSNPLIGRLPEKIASEKIACLYEVIVKIIGELCSGKSCP